MLKQVQTMHPFRIRSKTNDTLQEQWRNYKEGGGREGHLPTKAAGNGVQKALQ